jgi:hypothetical protein
MAGPSCGAVVCLSALVFIISSAGGALPPRNPASLLELPRSEAIALNLSHRAFLHQPGPAAAAWLPPSFDSSSPWSLVLHFHGFHNCVVNAVGNVSMPCSPSQPARVAYSLGQQLDASAVNAVLILPEGGSLALVPVCVSRALALMVSAAYPSLTCSRV